MATLNHIIGVIVAPLPLGCMFLLLGLFVRRVRKILVPFALVWLWLFSTGAMVMSLGRSLENAYPQRAAEDFPVADAICLLGGGMGVNTNDHIHAEMWGGADRVWRAAELYRAGKAPHIFSTGGMSAFSTGKLLQDLGVPREAVSFIDARNTEEEGRIIRQALHSQTSRVLLVTSAWHMRRAEMMFKKAGVEAIPAACDYETLTRFGPRGAPRLCDFWPTADNLALSTALFKEHYAFWAYHWLRGF